MYIADLFETYVTEAGPQLVVLYSGRFQPFHLGHGKVFQELQSRFGRDNVWEPTLYGSWDFGELLTWCSESFVLVFRFAHLVRFAASFCQVIVHILFKMLFATYSLQILIQLSQHECIS